MIPKKHTVEKDGSRIIVMSKERQVYLDRRLAFMWPSGDHGGYFLMIGRLEETGITGELPYVVLDEGERPDKDNLYQAVIAAMRRWHAKWMFAEVSGGWKLLNINFSAWLKQMNAKGVRLIDTTEYSGIRETLPLIRSLLNKGAIIMADGPLKRQVSAITTSDLRTADGETVEQRFPAVTAFGHIISSYELYPYRKKKQKNHTATTEGYA